MDLQAISRAHRIGQTRPVLVYNKPASNIYNTHTIHIQYTYNTPTSNIYNATAEYPLSLGPLPVIPLVLAPNSFSLPLAPYSLALHSLPLTPSFTPYPLISSLLYLTSNSYPSPLTH